MMVVEGSGNLNDALEEGLVGLGCNEPDGFPGFVGVPEFAGVELAEAPGECGAFFGRGHGSILLLLSMDPTLKARGQECPRHINLSNGGVPA